MTNSSYFETPTTLRSDQSDVLGEYRYHSRKAVMWQRVVPPEVQASIDTLTQDKSNRAFLRQMHNVTLNLKVCRNEVTIVSGDSHNFEKSYPDAPNPTFADLLPNDNMQPLFEDLQARAVDAAGIFGQNSLNMHFHTYVHRFPHMFHVDPGPVMSVNYSEPCTEYGPEHIFEPYKDKFICRHVELLEACPVGSVVIMPTKLKHREPTRWGGGRRLWVGIVPTKG